MLTTELIRKIKQIEIRTRHLVNESLAGDYHSVFKGRGMEFDEVRLYQPGDEIRTIDWNVTARMGDPYVKRYVEERELTVLFVVDASGSEDFGSVDQFKRALAAELTAVLAFAATTNNDKVGLLIFTDQIELFVPPRKGRRHVLRMVRELLAFEPKSKGTNIRYALDTANRILKRRGIVFLVSDFIISNPMQNSQPDRDIEAEIHAAYGRTLAITNRRHDVIAVELADPLETNIADVGMLALEDAETGELLWVDTSSAAWRDTFQSQQSRTAHAKEELFRRANVDRIVLTTADDYVTPLTHFFQKRSKRK
ncbi:MAG: DUF58 domain-containing protein [Chloroflexota bacterium]